MFFLWSVARWRDREVLCSMVCTLLMVADGVIQPVAGSIPACAIFLL